MSRYGTPRASYRLQLHRDFPFEAACRAVPYLQDLGISHLYASPFFTAAAGSMHGYDVFDHGQVNPELGGITGLYELGEALAARDMGLIADIVPNHVGVGWNNPWWRDVLRYGQASRFASYFDIDWEAQPQMASGTLVVPVLGKPSGAALEAGELRLVLAEDEIAVRYFDTILPIAPASYAGLLGLPPVGLRDELQDPAALSTFVDVLDGLQRADAERSEPLLARWRDILHSEPVLRGFVEQSLENANGSPGDARSFDRLDQVLSQQHYRLVDWRVAGEELNYRRFFDVNSLAGIRVEREDVFAEVHRLLFDLVAHGIVTGVRVDHPDGLYDPAAYLQRLRGGLDEAAAAVTDERVPIYVEKILERDERLPRHWPVDGTTGYDFMARVDGLLAQRSSRPALDDTWETFVGVAPPYGRFTYEAKRHVARTAFMGEINVLALQLHRLAQRQRLHRDHTLRALREAITTVLACFPVYRTYLDAGATGELGRSEIEAAIAQARRREQYISQDALSFLGEVLLLEGTQDAEEVERRSHFRRRFQQLSGPIMAKGVEDTTFFRFTRLISLNEVGGDPEGGGMAASEVQAWFARRAEEWPAGMSASSTHDTKRSEDARARLHVISELPREWHREVLAWKRLNDRHRVPADNEGTPTHNFEYYLYQSLVATWPAAGLTDDYRRRIHEHATKAMREAKAHTSWIRPDAEYEAATHAFIEAILNPRRAGAFLRRIEQFVRRIQLPGLMNSLTGLTLKVMAPGFPDFYQGTECIALHMTDPDNRQPVDFESRARALPLLPMEPPALDKNQGDAAKVWLTRRLLTIREQCALPLAGDGYGPLVASGPQASHVFAFERTGGGEALAVVTPIHVAAMMNGKGMRGDAWGNTTVHLSEGRWRDAISGCVRGGGEAPLAQVLAKFPVAVLVREKE
ncbi:MAG: malto-oligosyltrehalose synthase [Chloroflexi bacterium]|nr:malto-oligosyltrehalose synthase [Chloroflexota bacterium]